MVVEVEEEEEVGEGGKTVKWHHSTVILKEMINVLRKSQSGHLFLVTALEMRLKENLQTD